MKPLELKAKMSASIYNGLKRNFSAAAGQASGYPAISEAQWLMLADAISDVALDIVLEIVTNAEVTAGIPTPIGGPTIAPGKIT